jgi:GT2 family glycosyltransferase
MKASVVIVTKDRKDFLRRAIISAMRQTEPVEILVLDDGSTDGTSEMVRFEFPQVRLERTTVPLGYVAQRNRAALLCTGEVIFSIDDDAEFSSSHVVTQTLSKFSSPRIAAIGIPYVEPHKSNEEYQKAPDDDDLWVADNFRGTAHAVRRDIFLQVGSYREQITHQGEEMDFCIRLLNNGFVVCLGCGDAIIHHEFLKRDWQRMDFYGRRNDILFAWRNIPMPYLPVHLLGTTFNGFACALRTKRPLDMIRGILAGYWDCVLNWKWHEPVSRTTYRLHRLLKKRGPKKLIDIEPLIGVSTRFDKDQRKRPSIYPLLSDG